MKHEHLTQRRQFVVVMRMPEDFKMKTGNKNEHLLLSYRFTEINFPMINQSKVSENVARIQLGLQP